MKLKGLISAKGKPKRYPIIEIEQLKEHEIVLKYRQMMDGMFNYYIKRITFKSSLSRYYYYFVYSCLHTLAARKRTSIRKILAMYGSNVRIWYSISFKDKQGKVIEKKKYAELGRYMDLMRLSAKRMYLNKENITNFLSIKVNLRTAFKFTKYC